MNQWCVRSILENLQNSIFKT